MSSFDISTFQGTVSRLFDRRYYRRAEDGVVLAIDGDRVDIRLLTSSNIIRYVEVIGNIKTIQVGQEVALRWRDNRPQVMLAETAADQANAGGISGYYPPDNQTLEYSSYGIRIKTHGVGLQHLNFEPAMKDHIHRDDPFTVGGWQITPGGIIWKNRTRIYPTGQIALGLEDDIIKLDSQHEDYRMWAGATEPEDADFSIKKDGSIYAYAGEIAGWVIESDKLQKNDIELNPLGSITVGTGDDVAVLSTLAGSDPYRLWIGDAIAADAPFRVTKSGILTATSAQVTGTLQSANFVTGVRGFSLDAGGHAELEDVKIRGRISTTVFTQSAVSTISGQMMVSLGSVLIADVDDEDATIDLDTNALGIGDIIQFKPAASRNEYMQILAYPAVITGGYRYTVERDINEDGACLLYRGECCVRKGQAAIARDVYPLASGEEGGEFGEYQPGGSGGSSQGGWLELDGETPYFGVMARFGPVWNQFNRVVQLGNLQGCPLPEYVFETWGLFIGDDATYLTYDETNGLRIVVGAEGGADTEINIYGISTDVFALKLVESSPDYVDERARFYYMEETDYDTIVARDDYLKIGVKMKNGATEVDAWLASLPVVYVDNDAPADTYPGMLWLDTDA